MTQPRFLPLIFILIAITFAIYSPALWNHLTRWDDPVMLTKNPAVMDLSWPGIQTIFTSFTNGSYVPLTILTYTIEHHFAKLNPFYFHLTNILLHIANVLLVFFLLRLITKEDLTPFLTALLFAVNPLNVEAVVWISARKDLLFSFFYLGSLISYWLFIEGGRKSQRPLLFSFVFFILSVLSKPQAMSLPFVLLALDHVYEPNSWKKRISDKIPFIIITIISVLIGQFSLTPYLPEQTYANAFTILEKLCLTAFSIGFYILQTLLPIHTSCLYPYPAKINQWLPLIVYLAPILLIASVIFTIRKIRSQRILVFAFSFFFMTLALPLLNIWLDGYFVSDRYMYLPGIGLFLGIIAAIQPVVLNRYRPFLKWTSILTVIYILFLGALSLSKCFIWKNDIMLWTNVIEKFPKTALAYNNRGAFYMEVGEYEQALDDINEALRINPHHKEALFNRALLYTDTHQFELAVSDYTAIIALDNKSVESYNNRGFIFFQQNDLAAALNDFNQALTIDSSYQQAKYNRAQCYISLNNTGDALADIDAILKADPNNSNALNLKKTINQGH